MIENCCCFTGHRDITKSECMLIENKLRKELITLISRGVDTFFCGGAVGFDIFCGKAVLEIKRLFPSIKLKLALPCPEQDKYYSDSQSDDYNFLKENCDDIFYASDRYHSGCMHERNRFMVEMSKYVISYCRKSSGGTFYTVKYAVSKNREIISL